MSEAYALEPDDTEEQPKGFDLAAAIQSPNIATDLDAGLLNSIGAKVVDEFKLDEESRKAAGWDDRNKAAMDLALLVQEEKAYPWPKASNVKYPLLATAAIQFNARAYPALIDGPEIVKGAVKGAPSQDKEARADRIGKHMSYQLLEEMDDWEEDTDRLLIQLPITGCAFRKSYFDPLKGYNCSHMVSAEDFVVAYKTKSLKDCPRATHVMTFYPHEVMEKMRGGTWLTVDLGRPADAANDDQAPFTFLEQHRLLDLDEDEYPEPYIVTVEKESGKVVRIVARFDETGLKKDAKGKVVRIVANQCFTKYGFIPAPDGSFYDIGFGTLLGPLSNTINSTINQLMDAGHLSNLQGGFIGAGVSIKSGAMGFKPGEWRKVGVQGGNLRDQIVPLPTKEPSSVLFQLLGMLIEAAKDVTATQDILGGDAGRGTLPVGTVSALIEQGLKTFTAIVKRLHRALKKELGILYALNARFLEEQAYFTFQDQPGAIARQDYALGDMDVVPVSDPNMATDMQRLQQAQFVLQIAKETGAIPPRKAAEVALKAARVPDTEDLLGPEQPPGPDPKMVEAAAKAEIEHNKLDLDERRVASVERLQAAQTQKTEAEALVLAPGVQQQIAQMVADIIAQYQGSPDGRGTAVQPPDVRGMAGPPPDPQVQPVPGGPAPAVDGGLGPGSPDGPSGPAPGGPPVGAAGADMAGSGPVL